MIVSHDPASTAIADRIVHIRDGRVSEETVARGGDDRGRPRRLAAAAGGVPRRAGIGTRAAASLEDGRIVVSAAGGDGVRPEPELAPLEPVPAGAPVAVLRGVVKTHGHGAAAARVFAGLDAEFAVPA